MSFIAKNFLKFSIQSNNTCPIFPLAKQHHLPIGTSEISSKKPIDFIHCDIWGRYKYSSLSDAHYFLTIVDDYTRFTWIFLMKHKHEAQPLIKHFFSYVSTQFESHIKIFRSDNGGEFLSLQYFSKIMVFFSSTLVFTRPNKMGWWNTNTATFYKLHEP